jgi:hypothetical protein
MVPPPLSHSRDRAVPLSRWTTTGIFESKKACEAERGHFSKVDPGAEVAGDPPPRMKYTTLSVSLPTIRASSHQTPPRRRARGLVIVDEGVLREAAEKLQKVHNA